MKDFIECYDNDILNPFENRCTPPTNIFQFQHCLYTSDRAVLSNISSKKHYFSQTNLTMKVMLLLPAQGR